MDQVLQLTICQIGQASEVSDMRKVRMGKADTNAAVWTENIDAAAK